MGYRLEGAEPIEVESDGKMVSDATVRGSIQVPASGQPLVLMADAPPTGGYPKIANVLSSDLPAPGTAGPRADRAL